MSAFALWLYCEYHSREIGPYVVDLEMVDDKERIYDFYIPLLDIRVRRYEAKRWDEETQSFRSKARTRWVPRRPSDDSLMLLAIALSGK